MLLLCLLLRAEWVFTQMAKQKRNIQGVFATYEDLQKELESISQAFILTNAL